MLTVERFVASQRELLALEQDEETAQSKDLLHGQSAKDLEKEGVCVTKLYPASIATGLYGRRVVTLTRDNLPNHSFSSGDIAGLSHKDLTIVCEGIVSKVGRNNICVAFEEFSEDILQLNRVCILKLTNSVTYSRYITCLKRIEKSESELVEKLLTEDIKLAPPNPNQIEINFFNDNLNSGQKGAVKLSLERPDMALIHGPPGTGKTTTLVEVVRQHVARGSKVLVCAPSNIAVDNLLIKLAATNTVVRLGHPARVNVALQHLCLDAKLKELDEDNILGDVRRDIDQALSRLSNHGNRQGNHGNSNHGNKQGNKHSGYRGNVGNIGELKKELRERELKATRQVLTSSQVVLATLTSAGREGPLGKLPVGHFSVCVIDEASQALEVACWMGMLNSKKIILAGDHLQLPPTIKSDKASKEGLSVTLMERLLKRIQDSEGLCATLTEQYRMNEKIMRWSSEEMYGGRLTAHHSVAGHVLSDVTSVGNTETTASPLSYIDTAGTAMYECKIGVSRGNKGEAVLVVEYLRELKEAGVMERDMAVITPYNLQIELIRNVMAGQLREVEVCTVDGFQGREKEAIIISMVRSNETGEIGFLSESRRMNVAVTRARRHVCLIGDSLTVKRDAFLSRLVQYFTTHGIVKSAFEFRLDYVNEETVIQADTDTGPEDNTSVDKHQNEKDAPSSKQESTFKESCSKMLVEYKDSDKTEIITFPGLNSYQRRIVHVMCEEVGLFSTSGGTGALRILSVSKTVTVNTNVCLPVLSPEDRTDNDIVSPPVKDDAVMSEDVVERLSVCKQCGKRLPGSNMELHLVHCKPRTFTQPKQNQKKAAISAGKKKTKKPPSLPPEDDTNVLDQAATDRLSCPVLGCKSQCLSYISPCRFCTTCHCTEHQLPEVHGCGEAARRAAHRPAASSSARQQAQNKNRLKHALKEREKERTRKKK